MKLLVAIVSMLACAMARGQSTQPSAQVGNFETSFVERSPLSEPKSLAKRLGEKDIPAGYDPKEFPCLVHVPENYSEQNPMAVVVLLNYKQSEELPASVLPQFDEANCVLVVPKKHDMPYLDRVGHALDIVHNIKQRYAINPKRIYVFGFGPDVAGERLLLGFPEVFTGAYLSSFAPYRPIKQKRGPAWKPNNMINKPEAKSFALAKSHPIYIGTPDRGNALEQFLNAFKEDGFKLLRFENWDNNRIHYPIYTTDWVPGVLKFLDAGTEKLVLPPQSPASRPAPPSSK